MTSLGGCGLLFTCTQKYRFPGCCALQLKIICEGTNPGFLSCPTISFSFWLSLFSQMATAVCAGGAALVREYFSKGFHVTGSRNDKFGFSPAASLVKAMMINSAKPVKSQTTVCPILDMSSIHYAVCRSVLEAYYPALLIFFDKRFLL